MNKEEEAAQDGENWYQLDVDQVLQRLDSKVDAGLNESEAERRRAEYGPNELIETGGRGLWIILWEQLSGAMVVLLIVAGIVSFYLDETTDAIVIFLIVVLNAALGFAQDFRAERAMAALKKLAVPNVRVRRGGHVLELSARELVPGDVVLLEAGNLVPADGRIFESVNLRIQESALTGESEAVEKHTEGIATPNLPLGDQRSRCFMGTTVTYGHGQAIVTETGMRTQLGRIANMLQTVEREPTPLQRRLARLGRVLAVAAVVIVAIVFTLGILRGEETKEMFMTALSLAVAAVPEGLPAVATVALAIGARRMLQRRALIRKLPAVETLGSVTVICSDKTGTLTENRMAVAVVDFAGDRLDLTEHLRRGDPELRPDDERLEVVHARPTLALLLAGGALCNDAILEPDEDVAGSYHTVGDPTEGALVVAAARLGMPKPELDRVFPRVDEVPFDSVRKRMTTVHHFQDEGTNADLPLLKALQRIPTASDWEYVGFTKGAIDHLLELSEQIWLDDHSEPLDDAWRQRIMTAHDGLAARGMRVLAIAFRTSDHPPDKTEMEHADEHLLFLGLVGMIDPPRAEVRDAVQRCKTAGIRPVMITGDHPLTAKHIAHEIGMDSNGEVMTGQQLSQTSDAQLRSAVKEVPVFARVSPEHKLRIVDALQENGQIVAMTGDGVNDAPALKKADIGVAMGITGTDVSKEASEMVLLDDNFTTIVNAVEQGRIVYDNIRKFVKYTLTSNTGEIWVMLLAPLAGMPLPLLPLQILWINLVTDGLPGLALAVEPPERETMRRPPYPPKEGMFRRGMGIDILWIGLLMGVISLAAGYYFWGSDSEERHWRTIIFTVLTLSQMGNALATRSSKDSLFSIGLLSNRFMLWSVMLTFVLQLALIYIEPLQEIFKTQALSMADLALCLLLSTTVFWAVEIKKFAQRRAAPS